MRERGRAETFQSEGRASKKLALTHVGHMGIGCDFSLLLARTGRSSP